MTIRDDLYQILVETLTYRNPADIDTLLDMLGDYVNDLIDRKLDALVPDDQQISIAKMRDMGMSSMTAEVINSLIAPKFQIGDKVKVTVEKDGLTWSKVYMIVGSMYMRWLVEESGIVYDEEPIEANDLIYLSIDEIKKLFSGDVKVERA